MGKQKARKPTYCQKKFLASRGLIVNEWLVYREYPDCLAVIHRTTGEILFLS